MMNVPSGVRSAIYIAVSVVLAVGVLFTNPAIIICAIGLSFGAGLLASLNELADIPSVTPIQTKTSSSLSEGKEADSYTDAMDVAQTSEWTNYPSTPMTPPEFTPSLEGLLSDPAGYYEQAMADARSVISGRRMSPGGYIPVSRRMGTRGSK